MIRGVTVTTLIFDVMGTVVDIEGSIAAQAREATGLGGEQLTPLIAEWDRRLQHAMDEIVAGRAGWRPHEQLRREALPDGLPESLAGVVHRLDPWPDSPAALGRLRGLRTVAALSNADLAELADLSRHGGLAWHAVLSASSVRSFKPAPAVYDMALAQLGVAPEEAMLVAAHPWDLRGAAARGYATAYIARPGAVRPEPDDEFDLQAEDLHGLADRLT
jgi:2-haloacid dehalogenase